MLTARSAELIEALANEIVASSGSALATSWSTTPVSSTL